MSKEWVIIFVSAGTDFIIASGAALTAAMLAKGDAMLPSYPVLLISFLGGATAFARTVQQALRKDTEATVSTMTTTITTPPPVAGDKI